MAAKQSSTRRRSTRTTAPTAPRASSSHMNQKRAWPGVPNRYRISCSSTVMRPKSMATVVVVLPGTAATSSTLGEHRHRGPLADGGDEQVAAAHLDDGLLHRPGGERACDAAGQAHQPRGGGGELVGQAR